MKKEKRAPTTSVESKSFDEKDEKEYGRFRFCLVKIRLKTSEFALLERAEQSPHISRVLNDFVGWKL